MQSVPDCLMAAEPGPTFNPPHRGLCLLGGQTKGQPVHLTV